MSRPTKTLGGENPAGAETLSTVALSAGQLDQAEGLITVMADRFEVEKADFSVLEINAAKNPKLIVAYTALVGVTTGSWRQIHLPENDAVFDVNFEGKTIDTRRGMSWKTYKAMVRDAKHRGKDLPDDSENIRTLGLPWSWTFLTGDVEDEGDPPIGYVTARKANKYYVSPRRMDNIYFRPAAKLRK